MAVHPMKRKKAFRLRVEGYNIAEVARECHIAVETVRRLENGYVDQRGIRHPGWREELERMKREQQRAELECGLALKEERIKAFKRLAEQAVAKIQTQFPNIVMKSPADFKALVSEVRELCKLLADELGQRRANDTPAVSIKADVTLEQVRSAFDESREVAIDDVTPPRDVRESDALPSPDVPDATESD